ncbi:GNAT family N-acetyltransferase [Saccharibacillus sacchari]|uniref:GNAT family N-acetyltransferase n=1 Tax=Saccharibacillus sacchari TaxID=456493 RepID=A0ACC6PAL8_9BACL
MGYTLQGWIGSANVLRTLGLRFETAQVVALSDDLALIPLDDELQKEINGGAASLIEPWDVLTEQIESAGRRLSMHGIVAYVEADYFGGTGDQSCIVWEKGTERLRETRADKAINCALKLLGVTVSADAADEFDTIRLGRHRSVERWTQDARHRLQALQIRDVRANQERLAEAVDYFWSRWGDESTLNFYRDCIERSCDTDADLPRFYLLTDGEKGAIAGGYALLRSDLNSRQDLCPWLACLYVEPDWRSLRLGSLLLDHAAREASAKGYDGLYLCTDLDGYYERYGWTHIGKGYGIDGEETKIYHLALSTADRNRESAVIENNRSRV